MNSRHWEPYSISQVQELMANADCPWWLAGGWTLDLFVGRQTRKHDDIDVLISRDDQLKLQSALPGWDMQVGDPPGTLRAWQPTELLDKSIHDIWGRPNGDKAWRVQFMLFDIEEGEWVYRRLPSIRGPLEKMGLQSGTVSYLAPEIQLLYKSKSPRPKDQADFEVVVPLLDQSQRNWLKRSLVEAYHGDHEWIARLRP